MVRKSATASMPAVMVRPSARPRRGRSGGKPNRSSRGHSEEVAGYQRSRAWPEARRQRADWTAPALASGRLLASCARSPMRSLVAGAASSDDQPAGAHRPHRRGDLAAVIANVGAATPRGRCSQPSRPEPQPCLRRGDDLCEHGWPCQRPGGELHSQRKHLHDSRLALRDERSAAVLHDHQAQASRRLAIGGAIDSKDGGVARDVQPQLALHHEDGVGLKTTGTGTDRKARTVISLAAAGVLLTLLVGVACYFFVGFGLSTSCTDQYGNASPQRCRAMNDWLAGGIAGQFVIAGALIALLVVGLTSPSRRSAVIGALTGSLAMTVTWGALTSFVASRSF
jgi:hypothetical protein